MSPQEHDKNYSGSRRVASISGFIFDLDGTLVDSGLDFAAMRRDMGLAENSSILEEITRMEGSEAERCRRILEYHELEGAKRAILIPGVLDFRQYLDDLEMKFAIVTRNSRSMAEIMLDRCGLEFDRLIAREDGPVKPNPWAILKICKSWKLHPNQVVMVGDYRFDIDAGNAAGVKTVFFTRGRVHRTLPGINDADHFLESFQYPEELLHRLGLD